MRKNGASDWISLARDTNRNNSKIKEEESPQELETELQRHYFHQHVSSIKISLSLSHIGRSTSKKKVASLPLLSMAVVKKHLQNDLSAR